MNRHVHMEKSDANVKGSDEPTISLGALAACRPRIENGGTPMIAQSDPVFSTVQILLGSSILIPLLPLTYALPNAPCKNRRLRTQPPRAPNLTQVHVHILKAPVILCVLDAWMIQKVSGGPCQACKQSHSYGHFSSKWRICPETFCRMYSSG